MRIAATAPPCPTPDVLVTFLSVLSRLTRSIGLSLAAGLVALAVLLEQTAAPAAAQDSVANVGVPGIYRLNAFGRIRTLVLNPARTAPGGLVGTLTYLDEDGGVIRFDPIRGYFASGSREIVLLRSSVTAPGSPVEVYVGRFQPTGQSISGTVYRLSDAWLGPPSGEAAFAASRQVARPFLGPAPAAPAATLAFPADLRGPWSVLAEGSALNLGLDPPASGVVSGSMTGTGQTVPDAVRGHYTAAAGRVALVRYSGDQPIQVFVGRATIAAPDRHTIAGSFLPLTAAAGATPGLLGRSFRAERRPVYRLDYEATAAPGTAGRCLTTKGSFATIETCDGSDSQRVGLRILPSADGLPPSYEIFAFAGGDCLGFPSVASGTWLRRVHCTGQPGRIFGEGIARATALPGYVPLVTVPPFCIGADLRVDPPRQVVWAQACRGGGPDVPDPRWRLTRMPF